MGIYHQTFKGKRSVVLRLRFPGYLQFADKNKAGLGFKDNMSIFITS